MNIFELVKDAVPTWQAATHYGLTVTRNRMTCCPFHNDRHPSMKLNDSYYYCFGCGAHGDVIDLVARLFGLGNYDAAQKLMVDFGLNPDKPPAAAALKKQQYQIVKAIRQDELYCQQILCNYLHLLKDWRVRYAPSASDKLWDDRFVEASQMYDRVAYMLDYLIESDPEERNKAVKILLQDDTISRLDERMAQLKKEEDYGELQKAA